MTFFAKVTWNNELCEQLIKFQLIQACYMKHMTQDIYLVLFLRWSFHWEEISGNSLYFNVLCNEIFQFLCYLQANWHKAYQYCRYLDMHLVSITSQEKSNEIVKLIKAQGNLYSYNHDLVKNKILLRNNSNHQFKPYSQNFPFWIFSRQWIMKLFEYQIHQQVMETSASGRLAQI